MSDDNTVIPVNGPATVTTTPDTEGNWCHMPDRTKLPEGTYLIHADGPGTTRWTMDRCGPHPEPKTPDPIPVTTVEIPVDPPVLPSTGSETTIAGIGLALVLIGSGLRKLAS